MPQLVVSEVLAAGELAALAPEWSALWRRCPTATAFQSPAWLIPWWRHFGNDRLLVLTVRAGGELVGALPLYVFEEPPAHRKLLPLGIGISDYMDGLFDPAWAKPAAGAALAHLPRASRAWDVCELHQLPPGSALLAADAPPGLADGTVPGEPCLAVSLPGDAPELPRGLPHRMAANLRYYGRRALRAGRVRFERATADTLPALLDDLFRLHAAAWAARGQPGGVLADGTLRRFHRDAAPALFAEGIARLHLLRLDGRPIAGCYGFTANGRACAYLTGFDPAHARLSPGSLVLAHAMEEAIRDGAAAFDFLRGPEPYKYHWGPEECPTFTRRLWPAGPATR
ncbi:MAG TPA: GNAT family N-acetyltransferase [Geminicoccaceae bacterium]|nr:GNAT family N-acetyltransferase [Geminicoccaceae bacterium]